MKGEGTPDAHPAAALAGIEVDAAFIDAFATVQRSLQAVQDDVRLMAASCAEMGSRLEVRRPAAGRARAVRAHPSTRRRRRATRRG